MKKYYWIMALLVIGVGGVGYWLGRGQEPVVEEPATTHVEVPKVVAAGPASVPAPPSLDTLLVRLESGDPAAAKLLADMPYERRGELRVLARKADVPKVQRMLLDRLAQMDAYLAVHPLPISLHVNGEDLQAVAARLSAATGVSIKANPILAGTRLFTLDAENKSFWEIILALSAQNPIEPLGSQDQFELMDSGLNRVNRTQQKIVQGPFILYAGRMTSPARGQTPAREQLLYTLAADPRMPVMGGRVDLTLFDKDGKEIPAPPRTFPLPDRLPPNFDGNVHSSSLNLTPYMELHPGVTIAAAKAHVRIAVATREATIEINDLEKQLNVPVQAGRTTIMVTRLEKSLATPEAYSFGFTAKNGNENEFVVYHLTDGSGTMRFGRPVLGGTNFNFEGTGPFILRVRAAQEIEVMEADFEFKMPRE